MFFSKYSVILFSYLFLNNAFISTQARPDDIEPRDYYDGNEVDDDRAFTEEEVKDLEKELVEEEIYPDEVIEFEEEVVKDDDNGGDDDDDVKVEVPLVDKELEGEPEEEDDVEDEVKPYAGNPDGDVDDSNDDDKLNIPDELDDDKDDEEEEEDTKEEDDDDGDDDNDDDGSNGGDEDGKGNEDLGSDNWMDKVKKYYKNFRYYLGKK